MTQQEAQQIKHGVILMVVLLLLSLLLFFAAPKANALETIANDSNPIVCLYWDKQETRWWFGYKKAKTLVCFNFAPSNFSETGVLPAFGGVISTKKKKGILCPVEGWYNPGDGNGVNACLVLTFCDYIVSGGDCGG